MTSYPCRALIASMCLTIVAGCASGPLDPSTRPVATIGEAGAESERGATTDGGAASEAPVESSAQTVAAETPRESAVKEASRSRAMAEPEREPESSRTRRERQLAELRAERASAGEVARSTDTRAAAVSTAGSAAENAKLIAQLNETSRELAALRAANAKLSGERPRASASATRETPVKPDAAEEKIAAGMRSYMQFKQDLAALLAEAEKARADNSAMNAQLKDAIGRAEEAKAALARAENDLKKEKVARAEAEQAAGKLREQLRTIARAVSGAGLNLDKIADGGSK